MNFNIGTLDALFWRRWAFLFYSHLHYKYMGRALYYEKLENLCLGLKTSFIKVRSLYNYHVQTYNCRLLDIQNCTSLLATD